MALTPHKISFICFLDLFAASLIVPLMNNYLRSEIRLSNFSIGLISSTFSLLQIISAPTVGYLSDLYGRKSILLVCLFVCVVSYLLLGLFRHVFVIVIVRVLLGVFKHTQVICKAYISDICADSSEAYSQLMTVTFLGFFIGPALGGHIITYENGFMIICCIASAVFLVNCFYSYWIVTDQTQLSTSESPKVGYSQIPGENSNPIQGEVLDEAFESNSSESNARAPKLEDEPHKTTDTGKFPREKIPCPSDAREFPVRHTLSTSSFLSYCKETFNIEWSRYWGIFLIKFLYALSMSLFYSNYISVLTHNFDSSSQVTGYTVSFQGLVGSFSNIFITLKHKDNYTSLYYSFILLSLSVLGLYACANLYIFIALLVPLSISSSLIRVLCINITMTSSEANRNGNISGIYNSLTSIAKVVTPIMGGLVSDWVKDNYKVTFLVSFVFALLGVIVTRVVMVRSQRILKETKSE